MPDLLWIPELPVIHVVEFFGSVLTAQDGSEQRAAQAIRPRQSLQLNYQFNTDKQIRQFRTELFKNLSTTWRVPLWWDPDRLSSDHSSGAGTLLGDFTLSDISSGDTIILIKQDDPDKVGQFDIHNVAVKSGGSILLDGTTLNENYPADTTWIFKLQNMRIRYDPSFSRHANSIEEFAVTFDFEDRPDLGGFGAVAPPTFQQADDDNPRQLLIKRALAPSPIDISVTDGGKRTDFGEEFVQFTNFNNIAFSEAKHYSIINRAELRFWENFLKLVQGTREPFYVPTYRADLLALTQPFGPGWAGIDVADEAIEAIGLFDYSRWHEDPGHKSLRFATDLGEQYREVLTVLDNGDGTVSITFAGLTAMSVISEISFLERVRLAAGIIRFEHQGIWDGNSSRVSFITKTTQSTEAP
jgi:hypothetical protein